MIFFFVSILQVKIWFQNRRMKWRNSKERELIAHGGCREQTLPTKHNPNPDLSDPASPSPSQHSKQTSSDQSTSNTNSQSSSQLQIPSLTSKPSSIPYLGLTQGSLLHPSHHSSLAAAAALPWAARANSDFSSILKGGNPGQSPSSHSDMESSLDHTMTGIGCDSINGDDDDDDIDEDIEVEDMGDSDEDDKLHMEDTKHEKRSLSTSKNVENDNNMENNSEDEDDIQVA